MRKLGKAVTTMLGAIGLITGCGNGTTVMDTGPTTDGGGQDAIVADIRDTTPPTDTAPHLPRTPHLRTPHLRTPHLRTSPRRMAAGCLRNA